MKSFDALPSLRSAGLFVALALLCPRSLRRRVGQAGRTSRRGRYDALKSDVKSEWSDLTN